MVNDTDSSKNFFYNFSFWKHIHIKHTHIHQVWKLSEITTEVFCCVCLSLNSFSFLLKLTTVLNETTEAFQLVFIISLAHAT